MNRSNRKIGIIGSGIAGMAAAIELAHAGYHVEIFEKNESPGGRGRSFTEAGFTYDMGPSWYWMPEIFETFFNEFGKSTKDYFELIRLDPSYRMFFKEGFIDAPAQMEQINRIFEDLEPGSSLFLEKFLKDAKIKYEIGMNQFVRKPASNVREYLNWKIIKNAFKLQLITSIESLIFKGVKNTKLRSWLTFPVLFLGAKPSETPALYSLMNYADFNQGTWYPKGGMVQLFLALYQLALEKGVLFHFNAPVLKIKSNHSLVHGLETHQGLFPFDAIISTADYHHTDVNLLEPEFRQYSDRYWNSRVFAPSSLLFYLGFNKKLKGLIHHNLFFDADLERHGQEIYDHPQWPKDPLFYVSVPSVTDPSVAPENHENLFILVPIAPGLEDNEAIRMQYLDLIIERIEIKTEQKIKDCIIYKKSFSVNDFISEYNSFKGNAYGLSNILRQTAFLKPKIKHKSLSNLFFAGQLTHPGPGLPPSLISGQIAAKLAIKKMQA